VTNIYDQQRLKLDNVCPRKNFQHHLKGNETKFKTETKQIIKKFFNFIPKKQKHPQNDSIWNCNFF